MAVELLTEEAREALQEAKVVGPFVYLPFGVSSEVARQVERVLIALRGTKNRAERAFLFPYDPSRALAQVLQTNVVPPKNPLNFYWTPAPLLKRLLANRPFAGKRRLFDATAGDGVIAEALREDYPDAYIACGELDPFRRGLLEQRGYSVVCENILDYYPMFEERYGGICTNPPFKRGEDRFYWMRIIWHLWVHCLEPGGTLMTITANLLRNDWRTKDFLAFVEMYGTWEMNGREAFREAGANVATAIIRLEKPLGYSVPSEMPLFLREEKPEQVRERTPRVPRSGRSRRRPPTEEELELAEAKRQSVRGWLKFGSQALFEELRQGREEELSAWASVAARFCWKYSAWNILLIRYQNPQAIHLEGFFTWQDRYHHAVIADEKGISIQMPLPWKRETQGNGEVVVEEGLGFKTKSVYDVRQVEPQSEKARMARAKRRAEREDPDAEESAEMGEASPFARKLPSLPYIEPEQADAYRVSISLQAERLVWMIPEANNGLEPLYSMRARFAAFLVMRYFGIEEEFPAGYREIWRQFLADAKALMHELEEIRKLAAQVIIALEEAGEKKAEQIVC